MSEKKRVDEPTGTETVGHEWDGIEELDTPMPRWWVLTFYATIIWAIGYVILYPAIPMLNSASEGLLGWSSRIDFQRIGSHQPRIPITIVQRRYAEMPGHTVLVSIKNTLIGDNIRASRDEIVPFRKICITGIVREHVGFYDLVMIFSIQLYQMDNRDFDFDFMILVIAQIANLEIIAGKIGLSFHIGDGTRRWLRKI